MDRASVDFYTNPTFAWLVDRIKIMEAKEDITLRATGRGESETNFNYQTGIVDGIDRVGQLIENERKKALDEGSDDSE
jgi:hypothetical protein